MAFIGHPRDQRPLAPVTSALPTEPVALGPPDKCLLMIRQVKKMHLLEGGPGLNRAREKVRGEGDSSARVARSRRPQPVGRPAVLTGAEGLEKQGERGDRGCSVNQRRVTTQAHAFLPSAD